ncbi:MAG: MFS transporter [Candidatus Nanopelagicales bacterium]
MEPKRAPVVLATLILVAAVANLNLAVANVALPSIGDAFDASQTSLNMIAVGFSLGLAASVLYLGAVGDRYGRKLLLLVGTGLSIPAALLAAFAWTESVLILARVFGGICAGMAYPTTLALITALWPDGPKRTAAIAKWSALGSGAMVLAPLVAGWLLENFWWGSVFLITVPLAAIAWLLAWRLIPAHVNETTEPVDNLGGVLSVVLIAGLVLAINFAPTPGGLPLAAAFGALTLVTALLFVRRQQRASNPLYDLTIASRRLFWVAAVAGIIVFGTLMGTMYIGQQFLQNVLHYSTLAAGAAVLPSSVAMVLVAGLSARLVVRSGSRSTLLIGFACIAAGFVAMLLLWGEQTGYWAIALAYVLIGLGVGFAGTPASHSLTASVPVHRAGMASGTADLQRDLGGAVMQSVLGVLLTVGYASAMGAAIAGAPNANQINDTVQTQLEKSFAGAESVARQYPQYSDAIQSAARAAFLHGANWAYAAGILAMVVGALVTWFWYPGKAGEAADLAEYARADEQTPAAASR